MSFSRPPPPPPPPPPPAVQQQQQQQRSQMMMNTEFRNNNNNNNNTATSNGYHHVPTSISNQTIPRQNAPPPPPPPPPTSQQFIQQQQQQQQQHNSKSAFPVPPSVHPSSSTTSSNVGMRNNQSSNPNPFRPPPPPPPPPLHHHQQHQHPTVTTMTQSMSHTASSIPMNHYRPSPSQVLPPPPPPLPPSKPYVSSTPPPPPPPNVPNSISPAVPSLPTHRNPMSYLPPPPPSSPAGTKMTTSSFTVLQQQPNQFPIMSLGGPPVSQSSQQQQYQPSPVPPSSSFPNHYPPPSSSSSASSLLNNGGIPGGYPIQPVSMDRSTSTRGRYPSSPAPSNHHFIMNGGARLGNGTPPSHNNNNNYHQQQYPSTIDDNNKSKIDPSQIPRPPLFTRPQQQQQQEMGILPVYYTKNSIDGTSIVQPPPPSDSRYAIVDNGNASPDLIRSSLYLVPINRALWHQTGDIPWGIVCTPLSIHSEDYIPRPRYLPPNADNNNNNYNNNNNNGIEMWKDPQAVPVIGRSSYGSTAGDSDGPPRCEGCLAYINPFFDINDGSCNLCGHHNRRLLGNGMIGEAMQYGTVEYEVSGRYITRNEQDGPVQPISIYAIDLTCPDAAAYIPIIEQVGLEMYEHYQRQRQFTMAGPIPSPPRIGIVLVSCLGIIFRHYHPNDHHNRSSIVVVSDVTEEPFCPLPLSDWTYDMSSVEGLTAWQTYCQEDVTRDIEDWRQQTAKYKSTSNHADGFELSCGGGAFQFLSDALMVSGGRCTWISWRRPNYGVGMLPHRMGNQKVQEDDTVCYTPLQLISNHLNTTEEAARDFYKDLASKGIKNSISFDVIIHSRSGTSPRGLDVATLSELCNVTGGKLTWITCTDWQQSLREELLQHVVSYSGCDAVLKVRCSEGVQVKSFLPSGGSLVETFASVSPELEISRLYPNACIAIELEHRVGGIPKGRDHIYVQTALLYTTILGKRRVRVSTLAIRTSTVVSEIYRAVDFNTMISLLTRSAAQCIHQATGDDKTSSRNKARSVLYQKCVNILACYRKFTGANTSPMGQLLLPEKMLLLPLYCMCLLKSPMLRPTNHRAIPGMQASTLSPTNDERAYYNYHVSQALPSFAMLMVHPNVFTIGPYLMETEYEASGGEWQSPSEVGQWNGFVTIPPTIAPTIEFLADDGIYMIDDGLRIYLLVGRSVPDDIKDAIFHQQQQSNEVTQRLEVLLHQMRVYASTTRGSESELRRTWAPMIRVLQQQNQSTLEAEVFSLMVTDSNSGEKDYVDFLSSFHRRIHDRIETMSQRMKS